MSAFKWKAEAISCVSTPQRYMSKDETEESEDVFTVEVKGELSGENVILAIKY